MGRCKQKCCLAAKGLSGAIPSLLSVVSPRNSKLENVGFHSWSPVSSWAAPGTRRQPAARDKGERGIDYVQRGWKLKAPCFLGIWGQRGPRFGKRQGRNKPVWLWWLICCWETTGPPYATLVSSLFLRQLLPSVPLNSLIMRGPEPQTQSDLQVKRWVGLAKLSDLHQMGGASEVSLCS